MPVEPRPVGLSSLATRFGRRIMLSIVAVVVAMASVIGFGLAPASAAYTTKISTSVSIQVVHVAAVSSCVHVTITVSSDAGQPTGSVNFAIDGTIFNSQTLPSSGAVTVPVACGGASGTAYRVTPATSASGVENVGYMSRIIAAQPVAVVGGHPLPVGRHTLTASFVPTGNWAPSSASSSIVITAAGTTSGLPTGVDAGLPGATGSDLGERIALSGVALMLGAGMVFFYRRSAVREPAARC